MISHARVRAGGIALFLVVIALHARPSAQTIESITFEEAIRRAVTNSPTVQQAATSIVRAEAILRQVRAASLPSLDATFSTNVIDPVTQFSGTSISPRTQTQTIATFSAPLLTPVRWAERAQAADQVIVSQISVADIRRQVAVATAEAYLTVIAQRRVLESNERARENARAHFDYANQRFEGGVGSRLNMLRGQQELSSDEARVEDAQLAVRRAQEALGVLVAADGPVDAAAEPTFAVSTGPAGGPAASDPSGVPAGGAPPVPPATGREHTLLGPPIDVIPRADLRFLAARQAAAERVVADSWKDRLPSVTALFTPQYLAPAGLFALSRSWRLGVIVSVPIFDGGQRQGLALERKALLDAVRFERAGVERQISSEVRTAREAVRLTERALERTRLAVEQANEVARITDIAFREGATTNIEVIDAQRIARDAETTAAIAEDAVRRARLDVLVAEGRFPQ